jgi:hypothetical protein
VELTGRGRGRVPIQCSDELRYGVQTAGGHEMLTPAELSAKHGWKNDPSQVKLLAE